MQFGTNNFKTSMNELLKRIVSGVVYVVLVVAAVLSHPVAFALLFSLVTFLSLLEFHIITNRSSDIEVPLPFASAGGILLFISTFLYVTGRVSVFVFFSYIIFVLWMFLRELFLRKSNPIQNWAYFLLGQVMIAFPFSFLNFILFIDSYQPFLVLSIFIITWLNDTGAFLVGSAFGKHHFFERISPKKSWEGFFGGVFIGLLGGYVLSLFLPQLNFSQWLILSMIVVIAATLGDLTESLMKRTLNIKDSGKIIPGHGGMLDRFDSILMVSPFVLIFLSFIFA